MRGGLLCQRLLRSRRPALILIALLSRTVAPAAVPACLVDFECHLVDAELGTTGLPQGPLYTFITAVALFFTSF